MVQDTGVSGRSYITGFKALCVGVHFSCHRNLLPKLAITSTVQTCYALI